MWCFQRKQIEAILASIESTTLDPVQKKNLKLRVGFVLHNYRLRALRYSCAYHLLRISITVGSLIVPALLSIQPAGVTEPSIILYWWVWCLSLCVTISNGMMSLFKVDKKYFQLNTTYQLLISDAWQFIELSGKYNGIQHPSSEHGHKGQYPFYTYSIERIRMKQIEDEYYKSHENQQSAAGESILPGTPAGYVARLARQESHQELNGRRMANTPFSAAQQPTTTGASAPVLPRIDEASEGRHQDE